MPPRKARAVGGDDQCPMLKLIMEKGPLLGQIFDFKHGSVVSIGRVVRGNTISIKDAGISSKHMLIQVEGAASQRPWVITDLDSSNGTFLNGELLEPSAVLSDGDIIKIGEQTSIIVKFEARVDNESGSKNVRRNPRRGAKVRAANLGVIDELSELGLGDNEDEKKDEEGAEIEVKQERNVSTRRTRNSKKNEIVSDDLGLNEPEGVSTRRTRNSTKIVSGELGLSEAREPEGVSTRRTRNSRKGEEAPACLIDSSVVEGEKMGKGGRGRKKLPAKTIPEETEKEKEDGLNKSVEGLNTSRKDAELGSTSGVKESVVNSGKGKLVADLENMTLGYPEDEKKDEEGAEIEVKQERNVSTRRTRNSKKNEIVSNDLGLNEPEVVSTRRTRNSTKIVSDDLGISEAREPEGVSTRRTRNSRKGEEAPASSIDTSVIEGKKRGKGGRGSKKLPAKTIPEETEKEEEEDGFNKSVEGVDTSQKDAGLGSTSGVKESNVNSGKGKIAVDLENMTLGQWFDFLEVYLPQQIMDETEVMVTEMREETERFHEFMLQQKKANGENEVGKC